MNIETRKQLFQEGIEAARREAAPPVLWGRIESELRERGVQRVASRRRLPRGWALTARIAAGLVGLLGWLAAARGIDDVREARSRAALEVRPTPIDLLGWSAVVDDGPVELHDAPEVDLLQRILDLEEVGR